MVFVMDWRGVHSVSDLLLTIKGPPNLVQMHHLHSYSPSHTNEDEKFRSWTKKVLLVFLGSVSAHPVSVVISTSRGTREKVCLYQARKPVQWAF